MKKLLLGLLFFAGVGFSQVGNCPNAATLTQYDSVTGIFWGCNNGTWTPITKTGPLRDFVSVKDYGADETGVADSATAFTNACGVVTSAKVYVSALASGHTYKLNSSPTCSGTPVWIVDRSVVFTGSGVLPGQINVEGLSGVTNAAAPVITQHGATGSTTYSYFAVASINGMKQKSTEGRTTAGNATIDTNNYNIVTTSAVSGSIGCDIYRMLGGATTGKIGSITCGTALNDTGLVADGTSLPSNTGIGLSSYGLYSPSGEIVFPSNTSFAAGTDSPNLAMGSRCNSIDPSAGMASILGGGECGFPNIIGSAGELATTVGGYDQQVNCLACSSVSSQHSNVTGSTGHNMAAGGSLHTISGTSGYSFALGGTQNTVTNSTYSGSVGGTLNTVTGGGALALGGSSNSVTGTPSYAAGTSNTTNGNQAFAFGKNSTASANGAVMWNDSSGTASTNSTTNSFSLQFANGYKMLGGIWDMSALSGVRMPTVGGYAPTTGGDVGYDSTAKATVAGGQTVTGHVPRTLVVTVPISDILCAHGGDTTINSQNITGGSSTSSTITVNITSTTGFVLGGLITVTGASPAGFNVAGATIASIVTNTSVTYNSANNPGAWSSGGTAALTCNNATDATALTAFASVYLVPAGYFVVGRRVSITGEFALWTTATAETVRTIEPRYNAQPLAQFVAAITPTASLTDKSFSGEWSMTYSASNLWFSNPLYVGLPGATAAGTYNTLSNPLGADATSAHNIDLAMFYQTHGVSTVTGTYTYSSGSSACTNGTQTATATNGGGAGATGTITVSGNVPTGTITGTNTGTGYTSQPTTWTVATCTGTGTFTTSGALGGAQGNAIQLQVITVKEEN